MHVLPHAQDHKQLKSGKTLLQHIESGNLWNLAKKNYGVYVAKIYWKNYTVKSNVLMDVILYGYDMINRHMQVS